MERSAEWLRGEKAALRRLKPESWEPPCKRLSQSDLRFCVDGDYERVCAILAAAEAREAAPPPLLKRGKPRECTCLGSDSCTCSGPPAADQALPLAELQSRHAELAVDLFNAEARLEKAAEVIEAAEMALKDERSPLRLCEPSCQKDAVSRCMCRYCTSDRTTDALALIARYQEANGGK